MTQYFSMPRRRQRRTQERLLKKLHAERETRFSKRQNCSEPASKRRKSTDKETFSSASISGASTAMTSTEATTDINPNECCICFRTFANDEREETGLEWMECACTRWQHEDCIYYDVVGSHGKELLCPYCVV